MKDKPFFTFEYAISLLLVAALFVVAWNLKIQDDDIRSIKGDMTQFSQSFQYFWLATERLELYNRSISKWVKTDGLYITDSYYCVWTKDRSTEDITNTDSHELAHELVNRTHEHFCK